MLTLLRGNLLACKQQEEIKAEETKADKMNFGPTTSEITRSLLQKKGMHAESEKLQEIYKYDEKIDDLSPMAVWMLHQILSQDEEMTIYGLEGLMAGLKHEYPIHDDMPAMLSHLSNLKRFALRLKIKK